MSESDIFPSFTRYLIILQAATVATLDQRSSPGRRCSYYEEKLEKEHEDRIGIENEDIAMKEG